MAVSAGYPLKDAVVSVDPYNSTPPKPPEPLYSVQTDGSGIATINGIKPGQHFIQVWTLDGLVGVLYLDVETPHLDSRGMEQRQASYSVAVNGDPFGPTVAPEVTVASSASSDNTRNFVAGEVTDNRDNPEPNASVEVWQFPPDDKACLAHALTDNSGEFSLDLKPGTYTAVVRSSSGFRPALVRFKLTKNEPTVGPLSPLHIALKIGMC